MVVGVEGAQAAVVEVRPALHKGAAARMPAAARGATLAANGVEARRQGRRQRRRRRIQKRVWRWRRAVEPMGMALSVVVGGGVPRTNSSGSGAESAEEMSGLGCGAMSTAARMGARYAPARSTQRTAQAASEAPLRPLPHCPCPCPCTGHKTGRRRRLLQIEQQRQQPIKQIPRHREYGSRTYRRAWLEWLQQRPW